MTQIRPMTDGLRILFWQLSFEVANLVGYKCGVSR